MHQTEQVTMTMQEDKTTENNSVKTVNVHDDNIACVSSQ